MGKLVFYEKPGCATNSRQKLLLTNAGVDFETRSLLAEPWTTDRLETFFDGLPVEQWFNRAAPRVKKGEVRPERVSAAQALALMVADPLLIRRPLLERGGWRTVGFDWEDLAARFGVDPATRATAKKTVEGTLEGCSHGEHGRDEHGSNRCATPTAAMTASSLADAALVEESTETEPA